jgi:dCTP deaminase
MITPHVVGKKRSGKISYGQSSAGYDIRIGDKVQVIEGEGPIDPKQFDPALLRECDIQYNDSGRFVVLPPHSFALTHSLERMRIPRDVMVVCVGKSTYARCGLVVNVTPLEPGWEGYITLELSNTTPVPVMVYLGEGIAQLLFFKIDPPLVCYGEKGGKYQNQSEDITLPKVD